MNIDEKIYVFLCTMFAVLIITGNLIYQKFVCLPVLSFYTFELSVGAIIYPFTFLITDLIAEFYGKERAKFCVKLSVLMNIAVALIVILANKLDATDWSNVNNYEFNHVFGPFSIAFLGSVFACYVSQSVDVALYLWLRRLTDNKFLWVRNTISTAISLLLDTCIVISFLVIFGALSKNQMLNLIMNSYMYKLFFTLCSSPLFYLWVYIIKLITNQNLSR